MASMFESVERELKVTAEKARVNGMWFSSNRGERWLTPEEFEAEGQSDLIIWGKECRTVLTEFTMRDPRYEIRARLKHINQSTLDLQNFSERVFAYFNNVPKDKR
ncbi:hypothetical protein SNE25_18300 [Mucilaginibacter sabulilitoris]|uniref:Uncharacterized protein n=1 Tax=Mucilaginibacter sabulilitoris TaxID=1173583 RepID=A0ABZ0TDI4_9SPHI|nr:hypothetical protein [Mucilaginibacter sabulilitoris]WPU91271.1 hypothetical protein SNE25_18300 [Mucilaginibacter sabulilitoris]